MKTNEQVLHDLLAERYELWHKINNGNGAIVVLYEPQRHLLEIQLRHMREYLHVLDLRIENLNEKVSNDMSDL